ncbi:acyltransferase family protein [Porphyrobacter sp. ULC335]|uniref:acyltransferase family protein n=1 Tax=Porphyrobacter sp. ULC335 TaxID=2854260 RepID=UPI00221F5916|nr:acyltransferase [Porphyrobacter sp. ULC335]UYV15669.1 acyltransferase [Porphyrobacter sp. ULC335]
MTPDIVAAQRKVSAIQLLRALAALTVAAVHIAFGFADQLGNGLGLGHNWRGEREAQLAVMLFFIISGYVMVTAAQGRFGTPGARGTFWRRRFIRIMPPYWLASALMAAVLTIFFARTPDAAHFLRSLALIPEWPRGGELRPLVYLWVGWTLLYEMAFYFIFGLFLPLPRRRAILAVAGTLGVMILAGFWVPPVDPLLFALTRPLPVMFAAGMALALWRAGGGILPSGLRWLVLLAIIPAVLLVPAPFEPTAGGWDFLAWAGLPALLIAIAALGGPLALPAEQLITKAGDASYAIYLLHVPVAWFWLWFWGRLPGFDAGPWDYLASALAATICSSWLFFRWIERPMTLALNRWLAGPHSLQEPDRKTP